MSEQPILWWVRRDLRLSDNPGLSHVCGQGCPVIPVFILDPETEEWGAAPKWRLGEGLAAFAATLRDRGSRLILRRGRALCVLRALIEETGARAVHWGRLYDPASKARDSAVKAALRRDGIAAESHPGHLLHEPWTVATKEGGFYRVYTPFWRAVAAREVPEPDRAPHRIAAPEGWPASDRLADWALGRAMRRGAAIVAGHARVGEDAARDRLYRFMTEKVARYALDRDRPDRDGTSGLSQNLALGEIGARTVWHAAARAREEGQGDETFLKELVWREFAWHLLHHTPHIASASWREDWDDFPWRHDNDDAERWRRGMTGVQLVDAAMREMYVTGTMHNRARMVAASFLTKHLLTHWRVGLRWFEDCLIDWDPASNAMGWQWVAGSGPDAAPYFRVFNPDGQAERFDPDGAYRRRFIAEIAPRPGREALAYFEAVPESWGLDPAAPYPEPVIGLAEGRERALAVYRARSP
ncbi:MAG: cryptochrome/photolyase family protein [Gemmobacter sp.]